MSKDIHEHRGAILIAGLFVILATIYSLVTPVFEASDEIWHYPVVQYIVTAHDLPEQHPGIKTPWEQEGSQPPLYYLLSAALTSWIDTSDLPDVRQSNPHAKLGIPLDPDNKNMVIHTNAEDFPWRGTVLAVHLIRFFGIILSTASIILVYLLAQAIWPDNRPIALLAMAITAFNPMFLFITASVNNDNLTVLLSTWAMLLLARILKNGLTQPRMLTLGVIVALASLTKISGLTLLPLVGLALLVHGWRTHEWRKTGLAVLALVIAWLVLAGWWYARNYALYGEFLGLGTHVAVAGAREISLWDLRREWYGFWVSYWALFGAVNILTDPIVYILYAALSLVGLAGLVWWVVKRIRVKAWSELILPGLLALQTLIVFIGVVRWTLQTYASQGRLMFPAIGALSLLTAMGLLSLLPKSRHAWATTGVGATLLAIGMFIPFRTIAPTYAPPPVVAQIPADATPVGANFNGLELIAVKTESVTVEKGGRVPITLYWRASSPLTENYSVFMHALGRGFEEIGKIDTYPGGGTLPTTQMQPGVIIQDSYSIELHNEFAVPTIVRVQIGVGVWSPDGFPSFEPTKAGGSPFGNVIVEAGVAYPRNLEGCTDLIPREADISAALGKFARLRAQTATGSYHPGDVVPVTLYWDRSADASVDWTVFVQLLGADNQIEAQADAPPLNNDYPTHLWRLPCQFADIHNLRLPDDTLPGAYHILVGLYNANDPTYPRAAAIAADGSPYPDNAIPLGTITVEAP